VNWLSSSTRTVSIGEKGRTIYLLDDGEEMFYLLNSIHFRLQFNCNQDGDCHLRHSKPKLNRASSNMSQQIKKGGIKDIQPKDGVI
jgi:hypothetical protein